jgi:hypothetical protein
MYAANDATDSPHMVVCCGLEKRLMPSPVASLLDGQADEGKAAARHHHH